MEIDDKEYELLKAKSDKFDEELNKYKTESEEKIKALTAERDDFKSKYDSEKTNHDKLKDDYISFLTGHSGDNRPIPSVDDFDKICKDKFVSIVSHDLRSPLLGVSNILEIIDNKEIVPTEEERKQFLEMSRESIKFSLKMINELLNLPYEKRIEFMERECVKGTPKCKNFIPEKCVACWEQVFEKEFNKCL